MLMNEVGKIFDLGEIEGWKEIRQWLFRLLICAHQCTTCTHAYTSR
jgi:hypothetical protein